MMHVSVTDWPFKDSPKYCFAFDNSTSNSKRLRNHEFFFRSTSTTDTDTSEFGPTEIIYNSFLREINWSSPQTILIEQTYLHG
jgi:hypothetical protein